MSSNEALHLEEHHVNTTRKEQANSHHEIGRQLGWNRDEIEVGLHADLILSNSVRHGDQQCGKIGSQVQFGKVVDHLRVQSASSAEEHAIDVFDAMKCRDFI